MSSGIACLLVVLIAAAAPTGKGFGASDTSVVTLERRVADIEITAQTLQRRPFRTISTLPQNRENIWFGVIHRRLPGDPISAIFHDVPFAVRYHERRPVEAWVDSNFNGNLSEERGTPLTAVGEVASCVVELGWQANAAGTSHRVEWKVRLQFAAQAMPEAPPVCRVQLVVAPAGRILWGVDTLAAFAHDGNHDGIYTREYADGMFIDINRDGFFEVDLMSSEFLPFSVPARFDRHLVEVTEVDPAGTRISLTRRDESPPSRPPTSGELAPPFDVRSIRGETLRLADFRGRPLVLYFWASWCPSCRWLAPQIEALYSKYSGQGLEIIGVSYDTDSTAFAEYLRSHAEPWHQTFEGRQFWENRMGRLYRAHAAGSAFLIDREGRFDGVYYDFAELESRVHRLFELAGGLTAPSSPSH